ncbi:MAG: AAA family ATPase [Acidimicrobiia bacterium]
MAETHLGVVVFLGDRAYKFKKALHLPFVDYSTVEARRAACENEVRLNRRFAPDVYLGVGTLGDPDPARRDEPVVVMRRLPVDRRLSKLVVDGEPVDAHLRHLAHQLAGYHAGAPITSIALDAATAASTLRRWETNAAEMQPFAGTFLDVQRLATILDDARLYIAGRKQLFDDRIAAKRARDGHGDLLADDIFCLDDGPRILDCLEFDERLRAGDVLADVAFLAMDLERLGRPDLGWSLLELHRELLDDHWPDSLAHHQIAYRAQVRAKVACVRAAQGDEDAAVAAMKYLELCAAHLATGRVRLVLVGGLPGSGKSTLSGNLGGEVGAFVLHSDEVRKEVAGLASGAHAPAPLDQGIYTPAMTDATYEALLTRAEAMLARGETVVLDASWAEPRWRARAAAIAERTFSEFAELRCTVPQHVAVDRIARRQAAGTDASDADATIARARAAREAPWPSATDIDTTGTADDTLAAALSALDLR